MRVRCLECKEEWDVDYDPPACTCAGSEWEVIED